MNINQLLPRLSIRLKLAIAFAVLSLAPLVVVGVIGTRVTVRNIRSQAQAALEHDMETAERQTEHSLQEVESSVEYVARRMLGAGSRPRGPDIRPQGAADAVSAFLDFTPALFQVRMFDSSGTLLFAARAREIGSRNPDEASEGGVYYAFRAQVLAPGERLMLPVELRGSDTSGGELTTVPTVAFLLPIRDGAGSFRGVIVGEAYASVLFAALDTGSPHLGGVTGLVDADGLFLYHSERKRDWASLLASRAEVDLRDDFSPDVARAILSGEPGTAVASDQRIVSFLPIHLSDPNVEPLILYRAVPLAALEAPARTFLQWVEIGGLGVLVLVLVLAMLAAHQFTRPIYQLRLGARRLAQGQSEAPLEITTNDEFEDLANDFSAMARALSRQRQKWEDTVAERTKELQEAHAELAGLLEHSADAVVGLDLEGRIRIWNKGAESLFGHTAAEVSGRDVDFVLLPSGEKWEAEAAFIRREAAAKGAVVNFHTRRLSKDGRVFPVSLTHTVIRDEEGHPLGSSLIVRDTRLQTRLEEKMRQSERLAAVSVLAAGVAHELGNPLAVITNRVECMEEEIRARSEGAFLAEDLAVLREHADRLDGVIRDLLRFAQEEPGEPEPVALDEVAARTIHLLERTYLARDIRLETRFEPDLPIVSGSPEAISTVCMNLLLNAIDATPPGGKVVVQTRACIGGEGVELEVRDTGSGVPVELRHRIFEPFFTTKGSGRGTGLGLAVCRTLVERHGGRIWVESDKDWGSRFVVCLPLQRSEETWTALAFS